MKTYTIALTEREAKVLKAIQTDTILKAIIKPRVSEALTRIGKKIDHKLMGEENE